MKLPALATVNEAAALAALLPAAVANAVAVGSGPLRIDASAATQVDSSTLALLLQAQRLAQAAGRAVAVDGAPPKLVALAQLYGIESMLPLSSPGT